MYSLGFNSNFEKKNGLIFHLLKFTFVSCNWYMNISLLLINFSPFYVNKFLSHILSYVSWFTWSVPIYQIYTKHDRQTVSNLKLFYNIKVHCAMTELQSEENQHLTDELSSNVSSCLIKLTWFFAAKNGFVEIVSSLIKVNVNVDVADNEGKTALIWAAQCGYNKIVAMLIKASANTEAVDEDGRTALIIAAQWGHNKVVSMLIDANTNIEAIDYDENNALGWAAYNGHSEVTSMLINAKANIEAVDKYKNTAMMWAVLRKHNTMLPIFYKANANLDTEINDAGSVIIPDQKKVARLSFLVD
mmetsp:Transcript_26561/g.29602  ORF Transcript_26561/g.29602 Transcript_26561/m.29602 type:complete len:302 (+) Transcript_26561:200-1105(+)